MTWEIKRGNGLFLPQIGWYLDAQKPVQRAYASHAHFDHLGPHEKILCTPGTAALAQTRLSSNREYLTRDFGETFELDNGATAQLYPAGHIVGSSQIRLERQGESLLYTGDFKLSPSRSAEDCATPQTDILIMETTYGIPRYVFPPSQEVAADIVQFCRDSLAAGATPIIFGYSLGKSQEVLQYLADAQLPIMLHPEPAKLTATYQTLGVQFPPFKPFDLETLPGHVVIAPPQKSDTSFMKRIQNKKTAMISGWALDPSSEYRHNCDRLFPLSDHSDYLDLIEYVSKVNPQKVYTLHGFADEFAQTLRDQGYDAWPLGQKSQSTLNINSAPTLTHKSTITPSSQNHATTPESFHTFATLFSNKTINLDALTTYLTSLSPTEVATAAKLLIPSDLFDSTAAEKNRELIQQAFTSTPFATEAEYRSLYDQTRSHPQTIYRLASQTEDPPSPFRNLSDIANFLRAYRDAGSPMFRISLLAEEFKKLSPQESKRFAHILLGNHKADLHYSTVCNAIAQRFQSKPAEISNAYLKSGDIEKVALAASDKTLSAITFTLFHPVPLSQANQASSPDSLLSELGDEIWMEDLPDGLRFQVHKTDEHVDLFNDDLKNATHQFPEIADALRSIPQNYIAEGHLVAWQDERSQPIQLIHDRLARKGQDLFLGEETPVIFWLSDLIWLAGEDLCAKPLGERRRLLETFSVNATIRISPHSTVNDPLALDMALQAALARGSRGLIAKNANSPYQLGQIDSNWQILLPNS
ncbi:MAG: hypothetical protein AAGB46_03810 [Verrucomicrobiota bacterium]